MTEPIKETISVPLAMSVETTAVSLGVVRADGPAELVKTATAAANALAGVIADKKLFSNISGKRYVKCEGWTTLAAMMGVLPREEGVIRHEDGGYEAHVALVRMTDGQVLTRASAECGADEPTWKARPSYARRSMAVTRATSKACRIAFSWVMVLAGYEATPQEEIPHDDESHRTPDEPAVPAPRMRPANVDADGVVDEPVIPFGKSKGTPLSKMDDKNLKAARDWAIAAKRYTEFQDQAYAEMQKRAARSEAIQKQPLNEMPIQLQGDKTPAFGSSK